MKQGSHSTRKSGKEEDFEESQGKPREIRQNQGTFCGLQKICIFQTKSGNFF